MSRSKAYVYRHLVCYGDTNAVGNVYYASYLAWQGRVRELFLQEHVPEMCAALNSRRLALATLSASCRYFHELFPFDQVQIELRLGVIAGTSMTLLFDYRKITDEAPLLVATGKQRIRCLERNDPKPPTPIEIPPYFVAALHSYARDTARE